MAGAQAVPPPPFVPQTPPPLPSAPMAVVAPTPTPLGARLGPPGRVLASEVSPSLLRHTASSQLRTANTIRRPVATRGVGGSRIATIGGGRGGGGGSALHPPPPRPSSSSSAATGFPSLTATLTNSLIPRGPSSSSLAAAGSGTRRVSTVLAAGLSSLTAARADGDMGDAPAATRPAAAAVQVSGTAEPGGAGTAPLVPVR